MQNFEQIRRHISAGNYRVTMQDPYVMCVELSLDGGRRHQAIFLSELHDDDGRNYLRVNTVIAPITGIDARRALAFNWPTRRGYLANHALAGLPHLPSCGNPPSRATTPAGDDPPPTAIRAV